MSPRNKKIGLLLLAVVLLFHSSMLQRWLNQDREKLDLTRVAVLDNAPPVLAFTTVALGGFRGLIANMLWMRATDLQDSGKYFEMAQLADWITKLEPGFSQVWTHAAWNLAYNISVKFPAPEDRWRWVKRGIELLRDEGLKYNPDDVLIHRELAWYFQHKMGMNLDDANMYYKQEWARLMMPIFGTNRCSVEGLGDPQTPEQKERARVLQETFKMDPKFVQQVEERYGPLEWRMPEAHAIYWAAMGLKQATDHPGKVKGENLLQLRRIIYQSMLASFQHGNLLLDPFAKRFDFGPNLDIIPKVNSAFEQAAQEDRENRDHILQVQRNFVRDAAYFLYANNRLSEAATWYEYIKVHYPDKPLLDNRPNSLPRNLTLEEYALQRVQQDIDESENRDLVRARLEDLLYQAYKSLILGQNERATRYELIAEAVRSRYETNKGSSTNRVPMTSMVELKKDVAVRMLDLYPSEVRPALRERLGLPPETPLPSGSTNTPPR
jgi:hypothetical protein